MPRKKVYKDIHIRLSLADILEIEKLSRHKKQSKTDLIREALAQYFASAREEMRAPEVDQVTRQVRHLEAEVLEMFTLCWQAAAESMYVSLECFKQVSPQELSQEQLDQLKAEAKEFSKTWSKTLKEISLIDNAQLKFSQAKNKQLGLSGMPETSQKKTKPKKSG